MDFVAIVDQVITLLRQRGRVTYRTLQRQFQLDEAALDDLKDALLFGHPQIADEAGRGLVWTGDTATAAVPAAPPALDPPRVPLTYTPSYLAEKILTSRSALEGERKQVTVLFADLKGSMELLAERDPEDARQLLDPVLERMMAAVHRYEGTVNQVMGDGIMALFGAPIAHEDHAVRACYAALAMQEALHRYAEEVRRTQGLLVQMRVGLHSGEVVVRAIGNDLHMDYSAVGQTTHLAARMEQLAAPSTILLTAATLRLVEGLVRVQPLGAVPVKGLAEPVEVCELVGASALRRRLQAAVARGLSPFVGRQPEVGVLQMALERAGAGQGQIVALLGEPGVGKSRLVYEFLHAHHTQGWLRLESSSVSYGKATAYLPVCDLLKTYCHIEDRDDLRTVRAKVTGQILTLDDTLQDTVPAVLALFEALPADSPFLALDPLQRRQRMLTALKRVLLRESQVQPLLLVCEDLHWIDAETQALLDSLVESLPTARLLLLVNYRPEYQHGWGSKTYYTQLRLDPLPPARADDFLHALLGDDPSLAPLKQLLIARTEGYPFFLEESVRTLVETGGLVGAPGAYGLAQALAAIQVPATVQAVLAARIDRLPPEEKRLLQTAAILGTEVPFPLLQAMAEAPEEALQRGLAHLQAAEFLYETRLFPDLAYTFKHALTHEVAYHAVLLERRRVLHERAAQAIEGLLQDRLPEHYPQLAHHYSRSGNTAKAVDYLYRAGQQAVERSAYTEAISHLTAALDLLTTLPESRARHQQELVLQTALGLALRATQGGGAPAVGKALARARELCQHVGETSQLFPVLVGLRYSYSVRGEHQTARELAEQLLTVAQSMHDPGALQQAYSALGNTSFFLGEFVAARAYLEEGMALYDPQQHRVLAFLYGTDAGASCASYTGFALWMLGYADQALHKSHAALTLARELSSLNNLAVFLFYMATLAQFRRKAHAVQEYCEAMMAIAREQGFTRWLAWGTIYRGRALAQQGQRAEGMAAMRQGLAADQATGAELLRPYALALLAEASGNAGQAEEGLRLLDEALGLVAQNGERWWEAELYRLKGELLQNTACGVQNVALTAEECFQQARAVARRQQAKSLELRAAMSLARLWQQRGQCAAAYELLAPIYGWFTEGFDTADLQEAKTLLEELGG